MFHFNHLNLAIRIIGFLDNRLLNNPVSTIILNIFLKFHSSKYSVGSSSRCFIFIYLLLLESNANVDSFSLIQFFLDLRVMKHLLHR